MSAPVGPGWSRGTGNGRFGGGGRLDRTGSALRIRLRADLTREAFDFTLQLDVTCRVLQFHLHLGGIRRVLGLTVDRVLLRWLGVLLGLRFALATLHNHGIVIQTGRVQVGRKTAGMSSGGLDAASEAGCEGLI